MIPFRTQVKFFLDTTSPIDEALFTGVFQRWIQDNALGELLIDVADYRHVFQGPGTVLIGHESDYTIDSRDGRLGLLYTRKRQTTEDVATQLRTSLQRAFKAADLLEHEVAFKPALKFNISVIEVRLVEFAEIELRLAVGRQVRAGALPRKRAPAERATIVTLHRIRQIPHPAAEEIVVVRDEEIEKPAVVE